MSTLDYKIGRLAEEATQGIQRREFLKLLFAVGGSTVLSALGLDTVLSGGTVLAVCDQYCGVPCDGRRCCIQRAVHYEGANCNGGGQSSCGSNTCKIPQEYCKHSCTRTCWPSQCRCDPWIITYSCEPCDPPGSSRCLGCTPQPPSCPRLPLDS